jgi:hypothetical protein
VWCGFLRTTRWKSNNISRRCVRARLVTHDVEIHKADLEDILDVTKHKDMKAYSAKDRRMTG